MPTLPASRSTSGQRRRFHAPVHRRSGPARWLSRLAALLAIACVLASPARSQVNTEALRNDTPRPGFENRIGLAFEYQSGNSDYTKIGASYRLDYLAGSLYSFIVGSYERGSGGGELFLNDAFVHARLTWALDSVWRLEAFAQKEYNDFIQLRDRNLAGGGVRARLISIRDSVSTFSVNLGAGAMYESELEFDSVDVRTNLVRSTNYLNVAWRISKLLRLSATGYYQIAPARSRDFRVLADCGLSVGISDLLSLDTSVHYRFDHDPPAGVKRYDLHLVNGLGIHF